MLNMRYESFWWNNITGPRMFVSAAADMLLDNHMAVLGVPADIPWIYAMRETVQLLFRDRIGSSEIVVETVDAVDDNPAELSPGELVLARFSSGTIRTGYRKKSKKTIQQYITKNEVIKNRVIWVKGLRSADLAEDWLKFCCGFGARKSHDGLFVLEVQGCIRHGEFGTIKQVKYTDYVRPHDVQMFNSVILDEQRRYPEPWKKYIASVAASLCGIDAEISAAMIDRVDFQKWDPAEGVKQIVESYEYEWRGTEDKSHILWLYRNHDMKEIEHRVWRAQIEVFFPAIELERADIIDAWYDTIQGALESNYILQHYDRLTDARDAELSVLRWMMTNKTDNIYYILYIPDAETRERIMFLCDCRNLLAHSNCCSTEQITGLLGR